MFGVRRIGSIARIVLLLGLVAFGVMDAARPGPVAAASARITLSRYVAAPSTVVTIKGTGFQQGDTVAVTVIDTSQPNRRVAATNVTAANGGTFSVNFTVPKGAAFGFYGVLAQDAHNNADAQTFQVPAQIQLVSGKSGPHIFPIAGLHMAVAGTGFKAGETVTLSATFPLYSGARKFTKTVTADKKGGFGPVAMQVPFDAKDGDVSLTAAGDKSGKAGAATATLTVTHKPFLLLAPQQAPPGGTIAVEAGGFIPGAKVAVAVTIGGTTLTKTVKAGGQGFLATAFTLPHNAHAGAYTITATDVVTHFHVSTRFNVTTTPATPGATPAPKASATATSHSATITVAPISVIPGADAQILGAGFAPGTQTTISVSIKRTNGSPQTLQATVKTNGKGAFTATIHTPGDTAGGTYAVSAKDTSGHTANGKLVVVLLKTSVVVVPTEAVPGTPITVNGFGFSSGARVTIYLAGRVIGSVTANSGGAFKTSLSVPGNLATGMYTLTAQEAGRKASVPLRLYRRIATHFYFASIYTGGGFHEYLLFVNTSEIRAVVHITYQMTSGAPRSTSITVPAHTHLIHDVNRDLGPGVNAAATIATDVPISAERMQTHLREGTLDPGAPSPANVWYFANGNTSHRYQEYIAVQNPTNSPAAVTLQIQPTHSHTFYLHRTMHAQSRTTWHLNTVVHDAVGVIVTANAPIVANRTIFIHNGLTSKTGVKGPQTHWYFAAGPKRGGTRYWIGVTNTTAQASYMTLHAYDAQGAEVATIKKWLRPYDRQGFLMNQYAGQTDVAVVVSTTEPSIAEQSTFVSGNHNAHTDSFGVSSFKKTVEFAQASTLPHQDNLLAIFNPNLAPIPVVVQYLNAHGGTEEQTYIIAPLAHDLIDVGRGLPNSQLGLLVASNYPFVALDRQLINDGAGAMTSLGTQA